MTGLPHRAAALRPLGLAIFLAFLFAAPLAPVTSWAGTGSGESSGESTSSGKGSERKTENRDEEDKAEEEKKNDPDVDKADDNEEERKDAAAAALATGGAAQSTAAPVSELVRGRRDFGFKLSRWSGKATTSKGLGDYRAAEKTLSDATDGRYPDGRRATVGDIDGHLAQHMTDMFAAEGDLGARVPDAIAAFKDAYTHATVKNFGKHIEGREKAFRAELDALNQNYGQDRGTGANRVPLREWARVQERRAQLTHVLDVTIPALKAEGEVYRSLKDSGFGDKIIKDSKSSYVSSMKSALRQRAADLHDQQTFLRDEAVDLATLDKVGGAMGEVHKLHVDWDTRTVSYPQDRPFNGGFKPDDGVDLDMDLNITGVQTSSTMRMGARAVAYKRVANALGYGDMVPRTELARVGGKHGVLQEWVRGEAPLKVEYRLLDAADQTDKTVIDDIERATRWSGKLVSDYAESENVTEDAARTEMEAMRGALDQYKPVIQRAKGDTPFDRIFIQDGEYKSDILKEKDGSRLHQEFAIAEILDRLTGQVDRHSYNFIIDTNGRLKLIDNDQAFGHHTDAVSDDERYGKQSAFPEYIDSELADRIDALSEKDLRVATMGLLTGPEQEALVARLNSLKAKVQTMRVEGKLIYKKRPQGDGQYVTWSKDGARLAKGRDRSYYGSVEAAPDKPK